MKKSFSLIELSVALVVIGILTSLSLYGINHVNDDLKQKKNEQKIKVIQKSLQNYFVLYHRLPKPMDYTISRNNSNYGREKLSYNSYDSYVDAVFYSEKYKENITEENIDHPLEEVSVPVKYYMYKGVFPFKDLNLLEEDIVDAYGNLFEYYVPDIMTLKDTESPLNTDGLYRLGYDIKNNTHEGYTKYPCFGVSDSKNPSNICAPLNDGLIFGVVFTTNIEDDNAVVFNQPPYGLRVKNIQSGLDLTENGAIAYIIVSHGLDGGKTCALKYKTNDNSSSVAENLIATEIDNFTTSSSVSGNNLYSAQNCLNTKTQNGVIGRMPFADDVNKEFLFYQGKQNQFFDDVVVYSTLSNLLLNQE